MSFQVFLGSIACGDARETVRSIVGGTQGFYATDDLVMLLDNAIQITLANGCVDFMEFSTFRNTEDDEDIACAIIMDDTALSELKAPALVEFLSSLNGDGNVDDSEAPASYRFEGIGLTLWQPIAFEDALAELEHARDKDADDEEIAFLEREVKAARFFHTIGFGTHSSMCSFHEP
ncbi:hypothetical protein P4N68_03890 [Corynebacterium felinum]|uniref:Antirestriction protein (ArdA) n=1 Tax=Corynebacterium felinum TaxID=131318 RepID=A0ABU2B9C6_9CORY|nr:hypothetical protein [Corynebacterium felinum]MDF5820226.1 hypothetical protein [Corynebacterium felinum]MDR7354866.1 hypothetical protein [Corynebacterium felinum]WJY94226.1 hypothetical protein CFELI_02920 [Corynebacterium felinum]